MKLHGGAIQSERLKLMKFRNSLYPFYTLNDSKELKRNSLLPVASNYQLNHFTDACSRQKVYQIYRLIQTDSAKLTAKEVVFRYLRSWRTGGAACHGLGLKPGGAALRH
jgi:hypothetical protein